MERGLRALEENRSAGSSSRKLVWRKKLGCFFHCGNSLLQPGSSGLLMNNFKLI